MSSIIFFYIFVSILTLVFLILNFLLAPHNPYQEKLSAFECGFHSFLQTRLPFTISFFIYALIYLLLDLEILLVYPFSVSEYENNIYGLSIALIFIIIITIGFVFELGKGALKITSKQDKDLTHILTNTFISSIYNNSKKSIKKRKQK